MAEHAALTRGVLETCLEEQMAFPYVGPLVADYPQRGGRMMAPALCLIAVRACGGRIEDALEVAASLELMHNATLVHHDVASENLLRRGAPTLHRLHGVPLAINTGDALMLLSMRPLLKCRRLLGPELSLRILKELEHMAQQGARAWATEAGWQRDGVIAPDEDVYLETALGKSCWPLVIGPLRIGALIASRLNLDRRSFIRFGFFCGAALQIREEVARLDRRSPEEAALMEDLWSGRRTLPMLHLLERATPAERAKLEQYLRQPRAERNAEAIAWTRELMDAHGCLETALITAAVLAGAALHEAERLIEQLPPRGERALLGELAGWVASGR